MPCPTFRRLTLTAVPLPAVTDLAMPNMTMTAPANLTV